jgi:hypothetical protein
MNCFNCKSENLKSKKLPKKIIARLFGNKLNAASLITCKDCYNNQLDIDIHIQDVLFYSEVVLKKSLQQFCLITRIHPIYLKDCLNRKMILNRESRERINMELAEKVINSMAS